MSEFEFESEEIPEYGDPRAEFYEAEKLGEAVDEAAQWASDNAPLFAQGPQTMAEYEVAKRTLDVASSVIHTSPGAAQAAAVQNHAGRELVREQLNARAERLGGTIADHTQAWLTAQDVYNGLVRQGESPAEAQEKSLEIAAKRHSGTRQSYDDAIARISALHGDKRIVTSKSRGPSRNG